MLSYLYFIWKNLYLKQSNTDVLNSVSYSQLGTGSHFVCTHNLRCWLVATVQVYSAEAAVQLYTAIHLTLNITIFPRRLDISDGC